MVAQFVEALYKAYVDLYFTYLEINPLVITGGKVHILDLAGKHVFHYCAHYLYYKIWHEDTAFTKYAFFAAKLDATADFICRGKWGEIEYPPPFGRDAYPEEAYIADLDSKSGASLKV